MSCGVPLSTFRHPEEEKRYLNGNQLEISGPIGIPSSGGHFLVDTQSFRSPYHCKSEKMMNGFAGEGDHQSQHALSTLDNSPSQLVGSTAILQDSSSGSWFQPTQNISSIH
jgi:hypothetical protein